MRLELEAEPAAVIVPVLRRPHAAARFMVSLASATPGGLVDVLAIADTTDQPTVAAWAEAGARVVPFDPTVRPHASPWYGTTRPGSYAEKANLGYRCSTRPWLVLVGDDVAFQPGWLQEAQRVAVAHAAYVVGLGDRPGSRGAARLGDGDHACHLLIRRGYVDDLGGGWDGPGVLAHEGYWHWCVDDEIVTAAKMRASWAFARGAVVEHRHPAWYPGQVPFDATYQLGGERATQDLALFAARARHGKG